MDNFKDFCTWAGGQAKAARLIGISKARAHRLYHSARIDPFEAIQIERASKGLFRKERLVFGGLCGMWGNKDNNDQS